MSESISPFHASNRGLRRAHPSREFSLRHPAVVLAGRRSPQASGEIASAYARS